MHNTPQLNCYNFSFTYPPTEQQSCLSTLKQTSSTLARNIVSLVEIVTFPIRLLLSFVFELVISALFLPLLGLFYGKVDCNPKTHDSNLPTVLMIHGLMHNHTAFLGMRTLFSRVANFYSFNNGPHLFWNEADKSVEDYAKIFEEKVSTIQTKNRGEKIHIVAHSMGCLIALLLALKKTDAIASLTLITPPIAGSPIARFAGKFLGWRCLQDMEPDSELLRKLHQSLQEKLEASDQPPLSICVIGSETDLLVPNSYTKLPHNYKQLQSRIQQIKYRIFGHLGSIYAAMFSGTLKTRFYEIFSITNTQALATEV